MPKEIETINDKGEGDNLITVPLAATNDCKAPEDLTNNGRILQVLEPIFQYQCEGNTDSLVIQMLLHIKYIALCHNEGSKSEDDINSNGKVELFY